MYVQCTDLSCTYRDQRLTSGVLLSHSWPHSFIHSWEGFLPEFGFTVLVSVSPRARITITYNSTQLLFGCCGCKLRSSCLIHRQGLCPSSHLSSSSPFSTLKMKLIGWLCSDKLVGHLERANPAFFSLKWYTGCSAFLNKVSQQMEKQQPDRLLTLHKVTKLLWTAGSSRPM